MEKKMVYALMGALWVVIMICQGIALIVTPNPNIWQYGVIVLALLNAILYLVGSAMAED